MPVTPKQRTAMGDERADACLRAQAAAREVAAESEAGVTPAPLATEPRADDGPAEVPPPPVIGVASDSCNVMLSWVYFTY